MNLLRFPHDFCEKETSESEGVNFQNKQWVGGEMLEKENIDKNQVKADYLSGMKIKDLAEKHNLSLNTLKSWIKRYKWSEEKNKGAPKRRKRGAPLNNKNAEGKGAPKENTNAVKHGLFSKYFTQDTRDIYEELQNSSPLEFLWHNIMFLQAEILRSQKIMYVKDSKDKTESKIGFASGKVESETWQVQQAWDKQGNYLKSLSRAEAELRNMIKDYFELEGKSKADASSMAKDWKSAIIEIAKRRTEKNE